MLGKTSQFLTDNFAIFPYTGCFKIRIRYLRAFFRGLKSSSNTCGTKHGFPCQVPYCWNNPWNIFLHISVIYEHISTTVVLIAFLRKLNKRSFHVNLFGTLNCRSNISTGTILFLLIKYLCFFLTLYWK